MTINRAQGQTLLRGGLFLETRALSHGHLYVAFGRCGDPRNMFMHANQQECANIKVHLDERKVYVNNVFFKEWMQDESYQSVIFNSI